MQNGKGQSGTSKGGSHVTRVATNGTGAGGQQSFSHQGNGRGGGGVSGSGKASGHKPVNTMKAKQEPKSAEFTPVRSGRWSCSCGFLRNFSSRDTCFKCHAPRVAGTVAGGDVPMDGTGKASPDGGAGSMSPNEVMLKDALALLKLYRGLDDSHSLKAQYVAVAEAEVSRLRALCAKVRPVHSRLQSALDRKEVALQSARAAEQERVKVSAALDVAQQALGAAARLSKKLV
jgi:hypothetical protein